MFFPLSRIILYQDFIWLPLILQQKINKYFGCILSQGQQQLLCTYLKCFFFPPTHFWPFWSPVISACTFLVTDCHYIVRMLPGWWLLNQRCQPAETHQEKTKDIPNLGKNGAREIYMCLTFIFFKVAFVSLKIPWTYYLKQKNGI